MTTYSHRVQAQAILDVLTPRMTPSANRHLAGYTRIREQMSHQVAKWAYANNRRPTTSAKVLNEWKGSPPLITIEGPVGSGKTINAARVVGENGGDMIRAGEIDRWDYVGSGVGSAKRVNYLLIDDLGMERAHGRGEEHIIEILCSRFDSRKPTVITTMVGYADALTRYPEQLMSRLRPGWRITLGEDLRPEQDTPVTTTIDSVVMLFRLVDDLEHVVSGILSGPTASAVVASGLAFAEIGLADIADTCEVIASRHAENQASLESALADAKIGGPS